MSVSEDKLEDNGKRNTGIWTTVVLDGVLQTYLPSPVSKTKRIMHFVPLSTWSLEQEASPLSVEHP